jgi:transcriptional regulator with XRE-family HTH domain
MSSVPDLARRLRQLREAAGLTQLALARELGVSVPLISSWEKGTVPPIRRLDRYARLFASVAPGSAPPAAPAEMPADQRRAYEQLLAEFSMLREGPSAARPAPDHPLRFRAGQAITIVCAQRAEAPESSEPGTADHNAAHRYADPDALIALLPVVGALNPAAEIVVGPPEQFSEADLTDHVITLGHVDDNPVTETLTRHLGHIPVRQLVRDDDDDPGGFLVATDGDRIEHPAIINRVGNKTLLKQEVAHFLRAPNPLNKERTLTVFNGTFSRGTYGIVRALTDPKMTERNATHAAQRLRVHSTYSIVCRIKIVASAVVVPDWTTSDDRLHEWPEAVL